MKTRIRSALLLLPLALALVVASPVARADIAIPIGLAGFPVAASGRDSVKILYGTSAIPGGNQVGADQIALSVSGGVLKLTGDFGRIEDPAKAYSASLGILQPLSTSREVKDMSLLTSISFDLRLSNTGKALKQLKVSLVSDAYTAAELDAGTTLMAQSLSDGIVSPATRMILSTTSTAWQTVSLTSANFGYSKWNASNPSVTWEQAVAKLQAIRFSPETDYDSKGVGANGGIVTMEIRNMVFKGPVPEPPPKGNPTACSGPSYVLTDFRADAGARKNRQGGYWYAYTDTTSALKANDSAVGNSEWTAEPTFDEFGAHFQADLEKTAGSTWHPYAGWARIGTGFKLDGADSYLSLPRLKAIGFKLTHVNLDTPMVEGISFKVPLEGIGSEAIHATMIPARQAMSDSVFCIDVATLRRPIQFAETIPFDPAKGVKGLEWEVSIADRARPSIHTSRGNRFTVDNVEIWGFELELCGTCREGVRRQSGGGARVSVSYAGGELRLSGFEKAESLEILRLDGRRIAAFAPVASVKPSLERGTYLLVAKENGKVSTRTLPVLR